jgi:hypothetical protein
MGQNFSFSRIVRSAALTGTAHQCHASHKLVVAGSIQTWIVASVVIKPWSGFMMGCQALPLDTSNSLFVATVCEKVEQLFCVTSLLSAVCVVVIVSLLLRPLTPSFTKASKPGQLQDNVC